MKKIFNRSSGILLPVSSLPSKYGIGSFGDTAHKWIDFLAEAEQRYWQVLPLSPTGYGDSPYQSFSAFAGNPYFIDLETLREDGLSDKKDYEHIKWFTSPLYVDYSVLYDEREKVLRKAFEKFENDDALDEFWQRESWLRDYCLYMVLKAAHGNSPWMIWDEPFRIRQKDALEKFEKDNSNDIRYHTFVQYQFDRQWRKLKKYAESMNVQIIGDIPIYVSMDSADTWSVPEIFQLNEEYRPTEVAGCPPDSFAADGQLWGNPLYDWEHLKDNDYSWWMLRLQKNFELYDVVRLDHFRGLESYFAIPSCDKTAENGIWKLGPGRDFINAIKKTLPRAKIIAEDLGYLTKEVYELLQYSGYPGMKLVQYAFDSREAGDYMPYNYKSNSVVYPGTHDNDTLKGWSEKAPDDCVLHAMEYAGIRNSRDLPDKLIRLVLQSNSALAIVPMQDWLGLGSEARMNTPSTVGGNNWRWRMSGNDMSLKRAKDIAGITKLYGRAKTKGGKVHDTEK